MFDIAFSEVMIIAVVALIVIGPERLPRVARTLGHLFGRMQRYVNDVKADIQREVELDELRKLKQTVEDSARSIETSVSQEFNAARDEVRGLESLAEAQSSQLPTTSTVEAATPDSPRSGATIVSDTPPAVASESAGDAAASASAESSIAPRPTQTSAPKAS